MLPNRRWKTEVRHLLSLEIFMLVISIVLLYLLSVQDLVRFADISKYQISRKKRSTFYNFILNALSFQVHGFASTIWTSWYLLYWASSPNWWALWLVLWGRGRQLLIWVERKYRYMGRLPVWQSQPTISRLVVNAGDYSKTSFLFVIWVVSYPVVISQHQYIMKTEN